MDVRCNGAAHAHVAGTGGDRYEPPGGNGPRHEIVQGDAGLDINCPRGGVEGSDVTQTGHVDREAAAALGRVPVAAPHAAGDDSAIG